MTGARPVEIKALSGARAIPPLILVLYHFCEGHGYRNFKPFDLVVGHGYLWVEFFFALSGFILTHVYGARVLQFFRGRLYRDFLVARLARLYPLHLTMLLFILVLMLILNTIADATHTLSIYQEKYHPILTLPTFIANLFLVQAWNLFPYLSWNGASWFVSVEFLLCLLFPLYLVLARGGWASAVGLIAAGLGGLAYLSLTSKHGGLDITFHNGIFRGMSAFAVGVGMHVLYEKTKPAADLLPEAAISAFQAAVLLWLAYGTFDNGWSHNPRDIWSVLPMLWLVYALSFDRGFAARFFQLAPLLKLGEWSFAIYIGQTAWLQLIRVAEKHYPWDATVLGIPFGQLIWWPEPFAVLFLCIWWGGFLTARVEIPANRALRRLFA